jgi:NADPH:quinone reductase-like Zn-dependent oxidoreductase
MLSLEKAISVRGYTLFQINRNPELAQRAKMYIYEGLRVGILKPVIDKVFSFNDIAESQRYMESNQQYGKIVVKV